MKMIKPVLKFAAFILMLSVCAVSGETDISVESFFSNPQNLAYDGKLPAEALLELIEKTEKNLFLAVYELNDEGIASAIIRAWKRNVDVKLVTDSDNLFTESVKLLVREGVPVVSDNRSGLMHDKFILADGAYVWTGSYNVTLNGNRKNNNNALLIKSSELYRIYLDEFMEMYEYHIFGNKKDTSFTLREKNKHYVESPEYQINVFFSPDDDIEKNIINRISKAKTSIRFMAFSFTSDAIGIKMLEAAKRGVEISGIFESYGAETEYSEYKKLLQAGIPVKKDSNPGYLHHKVIIIDGEWVVTGSYNFSKNAQMNNDENSVIIKNKSLAASYTAEFKRLMDAASNQRKKSVK